MAAEGNANAVRSLKGISHQRNKSDELDVFEAASYFSGYAEYSYKGSTCSKTPTADSNQPPKHVSRRVRRMSLDEMSRNPIPQPSQPTQYLKEKVVQKQPSSPGGRLASFLSSIFNQTSKKKSKPGKGEEKPTQGSRRRRRSSISHFAASASDSNSIYASSFNSACKPSTVRSHTSLKDSTYLGSRCSHVVSLPTLPLDGSSFGNASQFSGRRGSSLSETSDKGVVRAGKPEKAITRCPEKGIPYKCSVAADDRDYRKFNNHDDGADSDSSSDLFELQSYDVGMKIYPTGLPVYSTAHIKLGAPIASTVLG